MAKAFSTQVDQTELRVILRELKNAVEGGTEGDVVEFGCYKGETSAELFKLVNKLGVSKRLWLYDSFEGLPPKSPEDASPAGEQFKAGELPATKKEVVRRLIQAGCKDAKIKKAWFSELKPEDLPDKIAFAFLDGDFYGSILDSLRLVWPLLAKGAVVVIDDYQTEALPGVRRALDEWRKKHNFNLRCEASLAIVTLR